MPSPAFAAGEVVVGSEEYEELEYFLDCMCGVWNCFYYDSNNPTVTVPHPWLPDNQFKQANIMERLLSSIGNLMPANYYQYTSLRYQSDPLEKWKQNIEWYLVQKVNAQYLDQQLRDVYNCSETNIAKLKAAVLSDKGNAPYYRDGYYYCPYGEGYDSNEGASISKIKFSDGKYHVLYTVEDVWGLEWGDGKEYPDVPCYAIVERKSDGGKGYWSLYYLTTLQSGQNPLESGGFIDVASDAYYRQPILWAVDEGITSGTGWATFSPNATCTRAQILTFLWRANGQPRVETSNPFRDVSESDYFYWAALWAAQKGLVSGPSFQGSTPCTRSMTVTYLWKLAGSPDAGGAGFTDVPTNVDYAPAVAWAVKQGITTGTSKDKFSPNNTCTRGQIVTFLYRAPKALSDTLSGQSSGNSSSSRYQYVIDDCSWTEAFAKAKAAGGYLVRIDDKQEYTDILAKINAKGMTDVEFRIGARRDSDKKDYYWVDANNKTFGEKINADNYWASSEWAAGEPSFRWDVNSEEFVLICFNSEENRWTWNDVADKVYSPGQGKYGYIVEFD